MKMIILALTFVFQSAFAEMSAAEKAELVKSRVADIGLCRNFFHVDEQNIYLGYGFYSNSPGGWHSEQPTNMLVLPLKDQSKIALKMQDSAIDIMTTPDRLFVLTYTGLEEWNKETLTFIRKHATYNQAQQMRWEDHPNQMARYQDKLIFAHGRLGMSVMDLNSKAIVYQTKLAQERLPLESKVTGVTVIGDKAYFVLDSYSIVKENEEPKPFQGLIVMDLKTYKIESQMEGLEGGSDSLFSYEGRLIISMYGIPLIKHDVNRLKGSKIPGAIARLSRFPEEGRFLGKQQLDSEYVYTCFQVVPQDIGGQYYRVPRVWKRSDLKLNN